MLVGKGTPERGGIPAFIEGLRASRLADDFRLDFLNVSRPGARAGGRASLGNLARTLRDVVSVLRRARRADVVHIHSALAPGVTLARAGLFAWAARLAGAGVVVHAHGGRIERWLAGPRRVALARVALGGAHAVVAVSRGAHGALVPSVRRVRLVRNGVDLDRFARRADPRAPATQPCVLFVGGLTARKGVLELFAASAALRGRGMSHRLVLAGGTPDEGAEAERDVREHAPPDAELLGPVAADRVVELLAEADVFCLPSWWEAMPLSILEAMAAGVPVVATAVGDVPEMLDAGAGLVVTPKDRDALTDALAELLVSPERRAAMAAAARARVETEYPLERTLSELASIYVEVLTRTGGRDGRRRARRGGAGVRE